MNSLGELSPTIKLGKDANIVLNFNDKDVNPRHRYSVTEEIVDFIIQDIQAHKILNIWYVSQDNISGDDYIVIEVGNYHLFCSSKKNNVLYVFGIVERKYSETPIIKERIENIFTIHRGHSRHVDMNQHLLELYSKLGVSNGRIQLEKLPFPNQSIPIVVKYTLPKTEIQYVESAIKANWILGKKLCFNNENQPIYCLFVGKYKLKAIPSPAKNYLYIFNIVDIQEQEQPVTYFSSSIFRVRENLEKFPDNENPELIEFLNLFSKQKNEIVNLQIADFNRDIETVNYSYKNIILTGVPGVGKTHNYRKLIHLIESGTDENVLYDKLLEITNSDFDIPDERVGFITFHQSYSYEEFIEGLRPNANGNIEVVDGIFKEFINRANEDREHNYYFVIDEINRGNIAKIFGELITLIEESKRDTLSVQLPYSKESFSIPDNLFLIGTMNITDQSISKLDIALQRRFIFFRLEPNPDLVCPEFREKFSELNQYISSTLGKDFQIGHSYFMNCNEKNLSFILQHKILPILLDYFYGDNEKIQNILEILEISEIWEIKDGQT